MSTQDLWVFGYGSLMWRPGFSFVQAAPARLFGYHRSFCVYSYFHRGTPQEPGLVFGLDRGGSCRGMVYRVPGNLASEVRTYLRKREQVTDVYIEDTRSVFLDEGAGRRVNALCFLIDRNHEQYAGKLPLSEQVKLIVRGIGRSGKNPDYLKETVAHLAEMGIHDAGLRILLDEVRAQLGEV